MGIGRAWAVEAEGPDRFGEAEAAGGPLLLDARMDRPAEPPAARAPCSWARWASRGREPAADDPWGPFGASSMVLPELMLALAPGGGHRLTASLAGDAVGGPATRARATLDRRSSSGPASSPPARPGSSRCPCSPPLAITDEAADEGRVPPARRDVRGGGRRGRIDKVVLARRVGTFDRPWSSTSQRPAPASRPPPREHDLRVPARRADIHRGDAGAAGPDGGPAVPDRRGRGHDPPRRRRGRGRGARPPPPRVGEGSRGARDRGRGDPGVAHARRRHARGRARTRAS